ncbi:MAG TPA: protease pro-enzyme activation domain-containing protein, partial [Micromonosporaceae bacterium]|nr:protease pro-enzyme activation domain-containing protein [Micromonosporaceae bacterium]
MRSHLARRTIARRALVLAGAAVLTVPFATSSAFAATSSRATLAGSTPSWATSGRMVGSPSASTKISFNVVLPLRNSATADKLAADVSNPKSASYGHYLTAAQFNARFAPTSAQVNKVAAFLRGAGISVTGTAQGNRWIQASATVSQVNTAFSTTLHNYSYKGHVMHAPSRSLSVPSSIASLIAGVVGVTNDGALRTPASITTPAGAGADSSTGPSDALPPPSTCSTFWDQHEQTGPEAYGKTSFPTPNCGYSAKQIRTAYKTQSAVQAGNTGRGVTVAIIDAYAAPNVEADTNALSVMNGEPQFTAGQLTQTTFTPFNLQTECGGEAGWNEEETLDVQAVHGMAPGANIHYVGAMNCDTGIDDAVNFVIQNHVANIVSNSYGFLGEDGLGDEVATEHSMFTQAAVQGIGFYFSSGDFGDNTTVGAPHPEPDFPASDPLVTAVGGTSLAVTSSNNYLFETSWGNNLSSTNTATSPSSYNPAPPGAFLSGAGGG